jgi:hypothetical protein
MMKMLRPVLMAATIGYISYVLSSECFYNEHLLGRSKLDAGRPLSSRVVDAWAVLPVRQVTVATIGCVPLNNSMCEHSCDIAYVIARAHLCCARFEGHVSWKISTLDYQGQL